MAYKRRKVSIGSMPRLGGYTRQQISLEKNQMDVRPMLFTFCNYGASYFRNVSVLGSVDTVNFNFLPLRILYGYTDVTRSQQFTQMKTMWNEYRIKKVSMHFILYSMTPLGDTNVGGFTKQNVDATKQLFNVAVNNTILCTCWERQSNMTTNLGLDNTNEMTTARKIEELVMMPQSKVVGWFENTSKPEFWTSITASGGGEANWLYTNAPPFEGANLKDKFCPCLKMAVHNQDWLVGQEVQLFCETEIIVECRGSKI